MSPSVEPFNEAKYKALTDGLECSEILISRIDKKLFRIEAEYFQQKYQLVEKILNEYSAIQEYKKKIECGPFGSNLLDSEYIDSGILVVRPFNLVDCRVENERLVYISENTVASNNLKKYRKGSLLFSRVGDIKVGYANKDNYTISPNIIIADLNSEELSKYAAVFFNTYYGKIQIERQLKVAAQPTISTEIISKLKLPMFDAIFDYVIKAVELSESSFEKSRLLYQEAEKIFTNHINFVECSTKNSSIKYISESFLETKRLDAEYYHPKYDEYFKILNRFKTTYIPAEFDIIKNSGTNYAEGVSDVGVIKTKQLTNSGVNTDGVESYFTNEVCTQNKSIFIANNDVVFASMGVGSLGKVSLFSDDSNKSFVTDSTLKIYRAKENASVLPEVLCIFLQSAIGQELIYRYVVGSTGIINIYDDDIAKIPIPVLDEKLQQDIAAKVQESFALRRQSKRLLEYAKQAVEMAIERDEGIALMWLKEKYADLGV